MKTGRTRRICETPMPLYGNSSQTRRSKDKKCWYLILRYIDKEAIIPNHNYPNKKK